MIGGDSPILAIWVKRPLAYRSLYVRSTLLYINGLSYGNNNLFNEGGSIGNSNINERPMVLQDY